MRVIAGIYRRMTLQGPEGLDARPTADRLRETIFNILQFDIEGARFLDLCTGSGAIGIEALSRGAAHATLVDKSRQMTALALANLNHCRVPEDEYRLVAADALAFLQTAAATNTEPWDLIYYDPPYQNEYLPVLEFIGESVEKLLNVNGRLMVEHSRKQTLPDQTGPLRLDRTVKQAESQISFYQIPDVAG
ncbi:MAG: 16S rRNA (guanine(966)-N(2))-methyltransferase RsmD [Pyrinomonadaceae bacterium]